MDQGNENQNKVLKSKDYSGPVTKNANDNPKSRIQLLQQRLLESKGTSVAQDDRSKRDRELKELAKYRLVNFDDSIDDENYDKNHKQNHKQNHQKNHQKNHDKFKSTTTNPNPITTTPSNTPTTAKNSPTTNTQNKMDQNKMDQNKMDQNKIDQNKIDQNKIDQNKIDLNKIDPNKIDKDLEKCDISDLEHIMNEFPSISSDMISVPSDVLSDLMSISESTSFSKHSVNYNISTVSSEWRDETLNESPQTCIDKLIENELNCSPTNCYEDDDITVEKIRALDRTMESLEELELLPRTLTSNNNTLANNNNTLANKNTLVSKLRLNSEPNSPTKLNISKRDPNIDVSLICSSLFDGSYNESFSPPPSSTLSSVQKKRQLVKTSTKFESNLPSPAINNNHNNYASPITAFKNSSPLRSTPCSNKNENHNLRCTSKTFKIFTSVFNSNQNEIDLCRSPSTPTTPNINSNSNSNDNMNNVGSVNPNANINNFFDFNKCSKEKDKFKECRVKRRSLSTHTPINYNSNFVGKSVSARRANNGSTATNFSIGFNPSLNSYDHPDDISRNLSFSTVDSACALHGGDIRDTLVKKYYAAAKVQQQILVQSENVLGLIYAKEANINDSARLPCCLDAESLLLLSTYRRNLFLHKASKLKRSSVPCKCSIEGNNNATASVSVSDISLHISDSFTKKLRCSQPDSFYYFMAIITFGDSDRVSCTPPISIYDLGPKGLLKLPGNYSNDNMPCDDSINIEIFARTLHNKKDTSKINDLLKIRFRKRPMKSSPSQSSNFKNRECSFKFVGSCAIPISEQKSDELTLFNRAPEIPLGAKLSVKLYFQPNFPSHAQGFLSIYKMEGGLPCWKRYWCALQQTFIKMWNWKDDDPNDCVMSVELTWDTESSCRVLPYHICARANTIEIALLNSHESNQSTTGNDFVLKSTTSNRYCIWLSADNPKECGVWLDSLQLHQAFYKDWKKAVSTKLSSTPSRRLV